MKAQLKQQLEGKVKTHELIPVGYYEVRGRPGDPPWKPGTVPIYGCKTCKTIHNFKERRGWRTVITNADYLHVLTPTEATKKYRRDEG